MGSIQKTGEVYRVKCCRSVMAERPYRRTFALNATLPRVKCFGCRKEEVPYGSAS
jgi:ribosomal protein S27E